MLFKRFGRRLLAFFDHGLSRHFRRQAMLELLRNGSARGNLPVEFIRQLSTVAGLEAGALYQRFGTGAEGLDATRAETVRDRVGANVVNQEKPVPPLLHLWWCYRNPFNLLLSLLALVSWLTEDLTAALVIGSMVLVSTLLRFFQEARSNRAAERLKALVSNTASVLRSGDPAVDRRGAVEVPFRDLVPGDLVLLSAGDMIPADLRVLEAKDLFISQAAITGESLPVEKFAHARRAVGSPLECDNLCFMGTNVVSGSARALVVGTGQHTYFGNLAERVLSSDREPTAFQQGVNKVSWLLIRFMLVMTPLVLLINGFTKGDWLEASLFALSIAVGLTPEMLPMIVTSTLAKGAVALSRKKVIVKRLDAIQNFGAMDVLCTDKTGTLTLDRIVLERHTDVLGVPREAVLDDAWLNSHHQTGLKNLLDVAVLEHAGPQRQERLGSAFSKVDEIPFDFQRRRMSVVVGHEGNGHRLVCKGALEEMLAVCTRVRLGDEELPLDAQLLARIREHTALLNDEGLRVVAVAVKQLPGGREQYRVADESDLLLTGYIAFLDPPKETTAAALRVLAEQGVAVKVLTGDNERVSQRVCREVGLPVAGLLLGSEIDALNDRQLSDRAAEGNLFARLTPAHKERIVRLLRQRGHVVGFMGDGINDAPALRAADVGISVDSAVDIAKEAADIILLEKSLMVLEEGVVEGRKTFANMLKYIKMTASSNFGNVFSVLVASAFLPFLPMLPLHLLVQNLLYDLSQTAIPFDNVDAEQLTRPQRWQAEDIGRFMLFFGPLSSIFDILTYAVMWFVLAANTPEHQTLFQSGWFVEGLLSQTLVVHLIRTRKLPFVHSRAGWPLLAMTLLIVAVGVLLPMSPLASYFKLQALPLSYFPFLLAILLGYVGVVQAMKGWFTRRYGWQ
ncbi:magnesium-translocating P-type ATPase [Pseudomonas sp. 5P_5.1_Bac1]|uniref:magnesium-translocating P-type ATPase n=1 Tax=Pseudomonas sp. 5P_5.1_Bac1 TaxID=2971616 RepID=UPI0021C5F23A|nr:magnesium-translocating P-type ATPase [Pseudomonas sp. 5P_5.1_Bac1]MCU1720448.1 magnesium-translocating P-type ATPase [Pseudomonas sp. 5P_5.1_Bac1]